MAHPFISQRRLGLYLLAWLPLAGLLMAFLMASAPGRWPEAFVLAVPLTLLYAFICLGSWYPSRANPAGATPLSRLASVHLSAALLSAGLWIVFGLGWSRLVGRGPFSEASALFQEQLPLFAVAGILLYLLTVSVAYLTLARETAHAARQRALELQVTAREAELKALRAQLDPHFLFNSLNSVSALTVRDGEAARRMCEQLGEFLRSNLEISTMERIRLGRELELALGYLQIERVRFGERLKFVHQADDRACDVEVPPLLLQPLVENAVKHGISQLVDGGTVHIRARRQQDILYLTVVNPRDPDAPRRPGTGLGIENVRRRLAAYYGDRALLRVDERKERFEVEVRIPLS